MIDLPNDHETSRTRVIVVGCGAVAQSKYFPALSRLRDRVEVIAVVDHDEDARALGSRCFPEAAALEWLPSDLGLIGADAAILLTPPEPRSEVMRRCFAVGLHVLAEKPVAVTSAEASDLADAARERGCHLVVAHTRRSDPSYPALKAALGTAPVQAASVTTLETPFQPVVALAPLARALPVIDDFDRPVAAETARELAAVLGTEDETVLRYHRWIVIESVIHDLDLLADAVGPATAVEHCRFEAESVGVTAVVMFGATRTTLQWTLAPGLHEYDQRFRFVAPDACVTLAYPSPFRLGAQARLTVQRAGEDATGVLTSETVESFDDAFYRLVRDFDTDIRGGRMSQRSGHEAARALRAAEALSRAAISSGATGHAVRAIA